MIGLGNNGNNKSMFAITIWLTNNYYIAMSKPPSALIIHHSTSSRGEVTDQYVPVYGNYTG